MNNVEKMFLPWNPRKELQNEMGNDNSGFG